MSATTPVHSHCCSVVANEYIPTGKDCQFSAAAGASQNGGELSHALGNDEFVSASEAEIGWRSNLFLFPLSSPLSPRLWAVRPSALPCAGAPPPQRPPSYNMPQRPGVDIGVRYQSKVFRQTTSRQSPSQSHSDKTTYPLTSPLCLPCPAPKLDCTRGSRVSTCLGGFADSLVLQLSEG